MQTTTLSHTSRHPGNISTAVSANPSGDNIYAGQRMDGTDGVYNTDRYTWQYDDAGLELVGGEETEMANVRCIRN